MVSDIPPAIRQGPTEETDTLPPLDIPHFMQGLKKSGTWIINDVTAKIPIGAVKTRGSQEIDSEFPAARRTSARRWISDIKIPRSRLDESLASFVSSEPDHCLKGWSTRLKTTPCVSVYGGSCKNCMSHVRTRRRTGLGEGAGTEVNRGQVPAPERR